jgi:hypothetical protein
MSNFKYQITNITFIGNWKLEIGNSFYMEVKNG